MIRHKPRLPGPGTQFLTDIAIAVVIIIVAFSYTAYYGLDMITRIKASVPSIEATGLWKNYMMAYHAINGEWPEKQEDLIPLITATDPLITGTYEWGGDLETSYKEVVLSEGALNLTLKGMYEGEIVTVHPAVPTGDPLGPVRFVTGGIAPEGWTLIGTDNTTIDRNLFYPKIIAQ